MVDEKRDWVFTFGVSSKYGGRFVEIHGTWIDARCEMFRAFGRYWAFQYSSREEAGVDKYGLEKMDIPRWSPLPVVRDFLRLEDLE